MAAISLKHAPCYLGCNPCSSRSFRRHYGTMLLQALIILAGVAVFPRASGAQVTGLQDSGKADSTDGTNSDGLKDSEVVNGTIDLLDGDFFKQWQICNSDPSIEAAVVWKIIHVAPDAEPVLVCMGEPKGFVFTNNQYSDFELTLEWKYPTDVNGNSGVLVYTQNEPRIWPTSVQVQLHQPKAGSIFPSGDATTDNTRDADPDLARPVNTWNECRIVSRNGRMAVEVNGKKAGEISGAKPSSGSIALQSEGSEVHFRRIRIRKLSPADPSTEDSPVPPTAENPPASPDSASFEFNRRGRHIYQSLNRKAALQAVHSFEAGSALTYRWAVECDNDGRSRVRSRASHGHADISHGQLPKMRWYSEPGRRTGIPSVQVLRFSDSAGESFGGSNSADRCGSEF